jgi:hypothetical protein
MFFGLRGAVEYFVPAVDSQLWVRVVNGIVSLAAIFWIDLVGRKKSSPAIRDTWAFAAYLLGCLLLSPTAEIHHLVFAIPAVFLLGFKAIYDHGWRTLPILVLSVFFLASFDIGRTLFSKGPYNFFSLAILLLLLFMANKHLVIAQKNDGD